MSGLAAAFGALTASCRRATAAMREMAALFLAALAEAGDHDEDDGY